MAVLSRSGELVCCDLSQEREMVRKLNKKASRKKSREVLLDICTEENLMMKSTWRSMALEETVFLQTKVHFSTML